MLKELRAHNGLPLVVDTTVRIKDVPEASALRRDDVLAILAVLKYPEGLQPEVMRRALTYEPAINALSIRAVVDPPVTEEPTEGSIGVRDLSFYDRVHVLHSLLDLTNITYLETGQSPP